MLSGVPVDIPHNATKIDLSKNIIIIIPVNAFAQNQGCLGLFLEINNIQRIESGAFSGLTKLRELDLSTNIISVWASDMFHGPLRSLRNLRIVWNKSFPTNDELFSMLRNLTDLDLSCSGNGRLSQDLFNGLVGLRSLSLAASFFR